MFLNLGYMAGGSNSEGDQALNTSTKSKFHDLIFTLLYLILDILFVLEFSHVDKI